jgi:SH3-like domain-containing protein
LIVRYDLVSLLGSPDDGRARPVADLRSGDELDVLSRRDDWVHVQTPSGVTGWISTSFVAAIPPVDAPPAPKATRPKKSTKPRKATARTSARPTPRPSRSAGLSQG